jgi:hypothetical protein
MQKQNNHKKTTSKQKDNIYIESKKEKEKMLIKLEKKIDLP